MAKTTKTRILILSDTHGEKFPESHYPQIKADVAIHCGDMTEQSKLSEFHITLDLLKTLDAPLKLVIAGNHDFTLDLPIFKQKIAQAGLEGEPGLVAREYGQYGEVRQLFDEAREFHNIHLLDEGMHKFILANGATLSVYASPYTASPTADWGYQFLPGDSHNFVIDQGTDIAITHSPPEGVLDRSGAKKRIGIPDVFQAVEHARPKLHCFGHVHEGWGAKLVAWRDFDPSQKASYFTAIDNGQSMSLDTLASFRRGKFDDEDTAAAKSARLAGFESQGCRPTSHCVGDDHPIVSGKHTLFVNASISGDPAMPFHLPWLVDLDLPLQELK
ncbi:hypothetical protein SEUCBS139899_000171 [Sporothrix eucalyptigena]